jgi:aspartate/methionine/tyrosine aminotransferase
MDGLEGSELTPPADGLVAFPRLPAALAARGAVERLRREAGLALVPGGLFEVPGRVRIGLGGPVADFTTALEAMAERLAAGRRYGAATIVA